MAKEKKKGNLKAGSGKEKAPQKPRRRRQNSRHLRGHRHDARRRKAPPRAAWTRAERSCWRSRGGQREIAGSGEPRGRRARRGPRESRVRPGRRVPSDRRDHRAPAESRGRAASRGRRGTRETRGSGSGTPRVPWRPPRIFLWKRTGPCATSLNGKSYTVQLTPPAS